MIDPRSIRAVRNNNPGNINAGINWQGLMPRSQMNADQLAEKRFAVFLSPQWGFRAMATILHTYARPKGVNGGHGVTTIRGAINAWAPSSENNTEAYVNAVCNRVAWMPDSPFPFDDPGHLATLLKAMSIQEVGTWAFSDEDCLTGVETAH